MSWQHWIRPIRLPRSKPYSRPSRRPSRRPFCRPRSSAMISMGASKVSVVITDSVCSTGWNACEGKGRTPLNRRPSPAQGTPPPRCGPPGRTKSQTAAHTDAKQRSGKVL
jgi:hypothetical protein